MLFQIRQQLKLAGLDGFIVPHADEYQGEYLPACSERLAFVSGFTGSAGCAVVLADRAILFTDGRYTIQAKKEIDTKQWVIGHWIDESPAQWMAANLLSGAKIGYDPWLHTPKELDRYRDALIGRGVDLVAVEKNPIDDIWTNRPAAPVQPAVILDKKFTGLGSAEKRSAVAKKLRALSCQYFVLTQADSIAWLLNIRGSDVPYNPLALSFALVHDDGTVDWYVDRRKISPALRQHLGNGVVCCAPEKLLADLETKKSSTIGVDPMTCAAKIADTIRRAGGNIILASDPCVLPKACKNKAEQNGMRHAHRRDGLAMVRFLSWLAAQKPASLDEISVADQLESFRSADPSYRGPSFATICGFGANGAVVHYRATPQKKSKLSADNILLLDSGAQYLDGTTDITRTLSLGKVTAEQRDRYTRVLKGHIALAIAQFPAGTSGSQLDSLARQFLWQAGLDYDHGTGHGVGCYLCVHEGPQRISRIPNSVALQPGMVISNEPGYYKPGAYGIRIENLLMVKPVAGRKNFLEFETLTLAPIDRKLIDKRMLTRAETAWINAYHSRVRRELYKKSDKKTAAWLKRATSAL